MKCVLEWEPTMSKGTEVDKQESREEEAQRP